MWMKADSTNGYVSQLQVYVGKETSTETGLGARVVKISQETLCTDVTTFFVIIFLPA